MKQLLRWCAPVGAVVISCGLSGVAHAQFRASIQGTVTDPTGAVIPGATLSLRDQGTNRILTATSNGDGVYNFGQLPPDRFELTAKAPGFQQKVIHDLQIIPEQPNAVNVSMLLGESTSTVNVSGDAVAAVDTETPNIGATVTSNEIQHLPSFNRDVFTLTQLAPGVVADGSQAAGGGVNTLPGNQGPAGTGAGGSAPTENGVQANANGQRFENNSISIDGISTVSAVWGGHSIITPTEDSVDSVRIVTNDYDAENGRFSGAQTMVTSKTGTNQLHGSAFIAIHRPGLNAYNRLPRDLTGAPIGAAIRDQQRFNQYGGSLGGPIWKNHLFAFFAFESSPNSSNTQGTGWYPTASFGKAGTVGPIASQFLNFAGNAVSGTVVGNGETCSVVGLTEGVNCNTIPGQGLDIGSPLTVGVGRQDPTASGTANNPGVGNGLDGVADVAYYLTSSPVTSYYRQYNGRLDADATKKDHLAFAIYWVPQGSTSYNGGARAYNLFTHSQINEALSGIWNHIFSPNLLNEARANASGWRWNEIASNPQQPVGLPQDNITFFGPVAAVNSFGSALGSILNQWTFQYRDVATKTAGRHSVKFGAEYTNLHYLNNPTGRPTYGFYNIWDFLNDAPYQEAGGFNSVTGLPGGTRSDERETLFGTFVQDDWKASPNLTLHAGLRYSYFGALYAKQNNLPRVQFGTGSSTYTGLQIADGGGLYNAPKGNFGPQLGFNWSPGSFKSKLVLRGGYGLNFNQEEIAITANAGNNPPTQDYYTFQFASPTNPGVNGGDIVYGISSSPTSLAGFASNPHTITSYNSAGLPTAGNASVTIIGDGHNSNPTTYTEHYSLETTYELNRELIATVGYEGSVARHLVSHETPNAPAVVAGLPLNPLVTGGDFWTNVGSSNNNQLLLELKHPMLHNIMLDAQFMWAKSLDTDGSGPYYEDPYFPENAAYSYGPSDFNVGKLMKLYGVWQPGFRGHGWVDRVAGEWTLTGILNVHTGFPYSPTYGTPQSLYCSTCGYSNLRPYYLGGGNGDHSNKAFIQNTNFPGYAAAANAARTSTATVNGSANTVVSYANSYFEVPNYAAALEAANGTGFPSGNVALPPPPGLDRNAFTGPHYRDVDASLTKGFGLPNTKLLGESARLEIRGDIFNLFNLLNLNPTGISGNITGSNFGQDTSVLGGRTISFQGRFSF
ncbi:MAG: carboxypeptidase regulatory-like domain-containing protein [Janthinobacterium lividum]